MPKPLQKNDAPSLARAIGRLLLNAARRAEPVRPFPRLQCRVVDAERAPLPRYLRATGGEHLARLCEPDAPLPPVYPALWELPLVLELFAAAGERLPRRGIVHLGSERILVRPVRPSDRLRCDVSVEDETRTGGGTRRRLLCRTFSEAGDLHAETRLELLFDPRREDAARAGAEPAAPGREVARWSLDGGHGRRYARVSGDYNPIHLWRWTSRPLGYRRPILHGLCLEAMVAHAVVHEHLAGEPAALRRVRISFVRPVLLPAVLALRTEPTHSGGVFHVVRVADDKAVAVGEWGGAAGG
jgi:acyl dehydratase